MRNGCDGSRVHVINGWNGDGRFAVALALVVHFHL